MLRVKRYLLLALLLVGCNGTSGISTEKITIGVVGYGDEVRSVDEYEPLQQYLAKKTKSIVELEPAYNEVKAIEQIKRKRWDLVFAPPGLVAIAISQEQYIPIFSLEGGQQNVSVIVVLEDSPMRDLPSLEGKIIALGQPGSATGYYFPIYNLYGLSLAEVRFTPTPKKILDSIAAGETDAGAISLDEYNLYRSDFPETDFRILHTDLHDIPNGSILISPTLEPTQEKQIHQALANVPVAIAQLSGYLPKAPIPRYQYLIEVVTRVTPIASRIEEKPARLYEPKSDE